MRKLALVLVITAIVTVPAVTLTRSASGDSPIPGSPIPVNVPQDPRDVNQFIAPNDDVVKIVRDTFGVPHVYASTVYGIGFGDGYAQAQDRLFQLDVLRHVTEGRGAEILGPAYLPADIVARRDLYTPAERQAAYEALAPEDRDGFDGFAAGVNRYIAEAYADPLKMPVEFAALGDPLQPWQVTDSLAVAQYLLAFFGAGNGGQEFSNAQTLDYLTSKLGAAEAEKAFRDLAWINDSTSPTSIAPQDYVAHSQDFIHDLATIPQEQKDATAAAAAAVPWSNDSTIDAVSTIEKVFPFHWGSNAVLISPKYSASGGALLGGGPQMSYFTPMIPYLVGLHGAGYDIEGIGVAANPGVVIGRTSHFTFTVTSGESDQEDIVAEKLVPGDKYEYLYNGSVMHMDCHNETFLVAQSPAGESTVTAQNTTPDVVVSQMCRTLHGPVIAVNQGAGWAYVRHQSFRNEELASGVAWIHLGKAKTLDDFHAAFANYAFSFNFHYVDDAGNIAYFHVGKEPIRSTAIDPRLPTPGTGEYEWQGFLMGDQQPHTVNPSAGWLANWNNKPAVGYSTGDSRENWGPVHRVALLQQEIATRIAKAPNHKITLQDVNDSVREAAIRSPFASYSVPLAYDSSTGAVNAALHDWAATDFEWADANHDGKYDDVGLAIWETWRTYLQDDLMKDELGPFTHDLNYDPATSDDPHAADGGRTDNKENVVVNAIEGRTAHDWTNGRGLDAVGTQAMNEAIANLTARFNTSDVSQWHEAVHKIVYTSLCACPKVTQDMVNRASYNQLIDYGAGTFLNVLPPGANEQYTPAVFLANKATGAVPAHAMDEYKLYVNWDYKPFWFYPDEVAAHAESTQMIHTQIPDSLVTSLPPTG
ncbi:MAG: penicillin acylase family protein [Thermoplasmatota archaeon]